MLSIYVWGTGYLAKCMMPEVIEKAKYNIIGFIDNDRSKEGSTFIGIPVYGPNVIKDGDFDKIVIMNDAYSSIYEQIIRINPLYGDKVVGKYYFIIETMRSRYQNEDNKEIQDILNRIINRGIKVFNYDFSDTYNDIHVAINYDSERHANYVLHKGKKMFFPRNMSGQEIERYYRTILREQDPKSPHKYQDERVKVYKNDVVIDAGAAEGNFSIEIIDLVKKIYIIESDKTWLDALKMTFQNYMDKVVIIEGYLSSYNDGRYITMDSIIHEPVNFLKMDLEGAEYEALCGAKSVIAQSNDLRMSICSYHSDYDQILINSFMDKNGIEHYPSDGYIWFPYTIKQQHISSKLVRCIVRGIKSEVL